MFNCGGYWNNTSNAGVFYANGNNGRTTANSNIGFRSALPQMKSCLWLDFRQMPQAHGLAVRTAV